MKKKVLLVGGRSKAKSLALSLLHKGYQVTAINDTYEDCIKLSEIEGLAVLHGDGTRPFLLEDASASEADICRTIGSFYELLTEIPAKEAGKILPAFL